MEFEFDEEQRQYQGTLRKFLEAELSSSVRKRYADPEDNSGYQVKFVEEFRKKLARQGLIGVGWPEEAGGGGKDMVYDLIFYEEMDYNHAPHLSPAYTILPPALSMLGTEEQKKTFLPKIAAGEIDMFLGYSEPEAGSDLANLQCKAILDGDEFVVNGQKLFSSQANNADYAWMAVRTDQNVPKHKGISLMIIDMKSPGISIDSYKTMGGWWHFGVQFENVHVPRGNLFGELNKGWYHLMTALDFERASNGNPGHVVRLFDDLLDYCRETLRDGSPLVEDPRVRNVLSDLAADVRSAQLVSYWVASMHAKGMYPQHETSLASLHMRETARKISTAHMELLGPYAQLQRGSNQAPQDGSAEFYYRNDMFFSFAAGGSDITRNVIASRGLGLPRS